MREASALKYKWHLPAVERVHSYLARVMNAETLRMRRYAGTDQANFAFDMAKIWTCHSTDFAPA